jgi:hypothetical protein
VTVRALLLLLMIAAPLTAGTEDVRVSVAPLPWSGGAAAEPFRPREGELCRLQVTVQNRSEHPVVIHQIQLRAAGIHEESDTRSEDFHTGQMFCEEMDEQGDRLKLGVRYSSRSGAVRPATGTPPYAMAGGSNTTRLNAVTSDGILLPGQSAIRTFPWMPAAADGALEFPAEATATLLAWSPQLARAFWFMAPGTRFPARPAWMDATETPHPEPQTELFWISYARYDRWPAQPDFRGALMDRGIAGALAQARGTNRIVVEPGTPAVKSLLVQTSRKPALVVRSASAQAWFLCSEGYTWIVTPNRRLELKQDVGKFLLARVLAGQDGEPWSVDLDSAGSMAPHLAGLPTGAGSGHRNTAAKVPPEKLIDMLAAADRLGLQAFDSGVAPR